MVHAGEGSDHQGGGGARLGIEYCSLVKLRIILILGKNEPKFSIRSLAWGGGVASCRVVESAHEVQQRFELTAFTKTPPVSSAGFNWEVFTPYIEVGSHDDQTWDALLKVLRADKTFEQVGWLLTPRVESALGFNLSKVKRFQSHWFQILVSKPYTTHSTPRVCPSAPFEQAKEKFLGSRTQHQAGLPAQPALVIGRDLITECVQCAGTMQRHCVRDRYWYTLVLWLNQCRPIRAGCGALTPGAQY